MDRFKTFFSSPRFKMSKKKASSQAHKECGEWSGQAQTSIRDDQTNKADTTLALTFIASPHPNNAETSRSRGSPDGADDYNVPSDTSGKLSEDDPSARSLKPQRSQEAENVHFQSCPPTADDRPLQISEARKAVAHPDDTSRTCVSESAHCMVRLSSRDSTSSTSIPSPSCQQNSACDELFPSSALNTPIGALRQSRKRLSLMLNIEQPAIDGDLCPDYTGLAQLLDFDQLEIVNFWERDPSNTLFTDWARCPDKQPFLWKLVECLETLGRRDILEDCRDLILDDVKNYMAEQQLLRRYAVENLLNFDCYVNIADEDLMKIGREIIDMLEGVYGLRLCLTLRDVTLGGFEFENMAMMLETRCHGKTLIVMTRHYENSGACQFLTQYAVTLDPGAKFNKLIPLLVDEDIFIPRVLRCLATVHYHRDKQLGYLWPKLQKAIRQK